MISLWEKNQQRTCELLARRAVFGLNGHENAELEALLQDHPDTDRDIMDRIAARCDLALGIELEEELPADLRQRIRADAAAILGVELR